MNQNQEPTPRPFQTGDRVRAAYHMLGCNRGWWEGEGRIVEIIPASPDDGLNMKFPPIAVVKYDTPVSSPCTIPDHDHTDDKATGWAIALTNDLTAPAYTHFKLSRIDP